MIIIIVLLSMFVRYKLGFGFSLIFIPLATLLVNFDNAFKMAILLEIVISTVMVIQFWTYVRWRNALLLKCFSIVGMGLGMISKLYIPRKLVVILSMVVIIGTCVYFLKNIELRISRNNFNLCISGVFSGFLNSWTSLSGPPVVIYYLKTDESSASVKGLLSGYFLILYVFTFIWLLFSNEYNNFSGMGGVVWSSLAILLGYIPIRKLANRLDFDMGKEVLIFIIIVAFGVILKELI